MGTIVGRQGERKTLADAMASKQAELVAVYGRRRIGKTFLVRELLAKVTLMLTAGFLSDAPVTLVGARH